MKCYNCSQGESQSRLLINYMGHAGEVYLCTQCMENFKQYASSVIKEVKENGAPHSYAWPSIELRAAKVSGSGPFMADAGEKIRRERHLGELREKLRAAVEIEDYESAAALRDEIYRIEKEVCVDAT